MGGTARTRSVSTRTVSTELMGRYGNTMKRESEPESEMRLKRSIRLQTYSSATSHVAGVNVAVGVVGRCYTAMFSTLEQTHGALVACDSH